MDAAIQISSLYLNKVVGGISYTYKAYSYFSYRNCTSNRIWVLL